MRPALCEDALRLGRVLAELAPGEPEVHGLVALMEIQASRARARVDASGAPVRLLEQDRGRWDQLLIRRGLAALDRAATLGLAPGPYVLQAEIAACHARARTPEATDWARIADALRPARARHAVTDRRAEPRGRRGDGVRSGGRPRHCRDARLRARAEGVSPLAERARRSARAAGPSRRGAQGVRARRGADAERPRAGTVVGRGREGRRE